MTNKDRISTDASELRRQAEETLRQNVANESKSLATMSVEEIQLVLHELQVHQIELEIQNEELRRTQVELDGTRARYFDLYDLAPIGYCTISEQGLFIEVNLTAATLLGINRGTLIGRRISQSILKEDLDIYYLRRRVLMETGRLQTCELRMVKSDTTVFWAHMTALAAQEPDGTSVHRIVLRDITNRKRAEESLRESEQRFRTLSNSGMALVWTSGTDKLCNFFNSVWLEFTGRTLEQEIGNGWTEGVHPDDFQRCLDIYVGAFDRQEKFSMEYRLRRHDGEYRWIVDEGCPRHDSHGEFIGYIGHCLDIDERKQAEDVRQTLLAEKEILLKEVHHRVKNNMAAIIGLFDMQQQTIDDPQAKTALKELSSRVRAMSIVHEKLYHSESLSKIDFQDYIESLVSYLSSSFSSEGVNYEIAAKGVEVPLDLAVPCGMIINELIINAYKYAFPKERVKPGQAVGRIQVTMSHDNGAFSLSVADNGVGLPSGFDLNIIETLGLTLVRMLGEHQLGGRYTVDQTCGTRFTLAFTDRKGRKALE